MVQSTTNLRKLDDHHILAEADVLAGDVKIGNIAGKQQRIIDKFIETNKIITECMLKPFTTIQEQLDYALNEAIRLTESKYGYIYLYDENSKELILNSWTEGVMDNCHIAEKQTRYKLENTGFWGEVIRRKKEIINNDFAAFNPLKKGYPKGHVEIEKFMSFPIYDNSKIVATIGLANKKENYTQYDLQAMTTLMNGVWIATKKREQEKQTELALQRTQSMINDHEAVMLILEPLSGKIIQANKAATLFYGYTENELLNMNIQDINTLGDEKIRELRLKAMDKGQKYFTFPHKLKSGEIRTVDVYSSPIDYNGKTNLFSIIFDVTKREEISRQNEFLAYHDHLTGIYNRRFFEEEFHRRMNGRKKPLSILIGDVDGFKLYNDTFGHLEGDRALVEISKIISGFISDDDIFARIGGDEFAIIISGKTEDSIKKFMHELENVSQHAFDNSQNEKLLSISWGYGIKREKSDNLDTLIAEAEAFMYNRKHYSSRSLKNNTVNVIMKALFVKSEREKNHSERVGRICEMIANELGLPNEFIQKVRVAGYFHDIGKISIDETILNKPGKLSGKEWEMMKLHTSKGAKILESSLEFNEISGMVFFHHERYDGLGYPDGLTGEEIPLGAKIIAVADAFDAMTNDRPYRKAMEPGSALNELRQYSGKQFDPKVVNAFFSVRAARTARGQPAGTVLASCSYML